MSEADSGATARQFDYCCHSIERKDCDQCSRALPPDGNQRAQARIAELEANEAAYERILGKRTYNEVAELIRELEAELAGCRACRAKVDCISRGEPDAVIPQGEESK